VSSQEKKYFGDETRERIKKGIYTATKEERPTGHVYLVRRSTKKY